MTENNRKEEEFGLSNFRKIVSIKHLLELIFMMLLYAMLDNVAGIKKYAVIIAACIVLLFFGRKKTWDMKTVLTAIIPPIVYILAGSMSALIATNSQITTVKVSMYILVPLLFVFAMYVNYGEKMEHIVEMQFIGSILGYALFDAPYFAKIFHWESIYAFTFGIFAVYYAHQKKWKHFVIAFLFVFFAEKRIALLAIAAALILMGILWLFRQNKKLVFGFWGIIIAAIYGYLYLIYSGIMEAFCWGANINTNGRVEIYSRMAAEARFSLTYLGKGLGTVENILECWNISTFVNLHNDLLKFFIELGFIGLLIYLLSYGIMFFLSEKWFGKSQMCFLLGIVTYTFILFATDNVSIYMIYLIPMYSTLFAVLSRKNKDES